MKPLKQLPKLAIRRLKINCVLSLAIIYYYNPIWLLSGASKPKSIIMLGQKTCRLFLQN